MGGAQGGGAQGGGAQNGEYKAEKQDSKQQ